MAWGCNDNGQSAVPAGLQGVTAIAAGAYFSMALRADGTVAAWGDNTDGVATVPAGLGSVSTIAAGFYLAAALTQDGTLVTWGGNEIGETIPLGSLTGIVAVASGGSTCLGSLTQHSLVLRQDGTLTAWGNECGGGESRVPAGLSGVTAISSGNFHNLALKEDRTVVAWGCNFGPTSNTLQYFYQSVVPAGLSNVVAVAAGGYHSLALKQNGTVVAWGENLYGQATPPPAAGGIQAIAAGELHSLALRQDGTVLAWGDNTFGQSTVPPGAAGGGVAAISAGARHSLALKQDGTLLAWGDNSYGQTTIPDGLSDVVSVTAGAYHNLALKQDGTVVAWGSVYCDCTGVWLPAATLPKGWNCRVLAVAAGFDHDLAVVYPAPYILESPQTQTTEDGSWVGLYITAASPAPPIYQWRFNTTNALAGATNFTLNLSNVQPSQAGAYAVVVTNYGGAVTSATAFLSVIPPVPRQTVAALHLTGDVGSLLHLDYSDGLASTPSWQALDTITLTQSPQTCFDLTQPVQGARFYRAWQTGPPSLLPALDLSLAIEVKLTGSVDSTLRIDCINQFGPTDAWVTLDTVTLTNTPQLYFDTSAWRQPPRLYRLVQVP